MTKKNVWKNVNYPLEIHSDERGSIADIFYNTKIDHVAIIKSEANVIRGNHYHKETTQHILITKGSLEYWHKKLNVKMFVFRDPVFSINKKHTIEFCEELIKRKLNIRFIIETHLRILDSELIKILKLAGLKGVKVGVESGDEEVLKNANRFTIEKDAQLSKIRELEKNNILVSAMFIIGFPTDDENSIMKTINYAKKLNTTFSQFSVWTPYPGTPVFKEHENEIIAEKFEEFDQYNLVFKHKNLSPEEIRILLGKTYTLYYGRISWFFKFLKNSILA